MFAAGLSGFELWEVPWASAGIETEHTEPGKKGRIRIAKRR